MVHVFRTVVEVCDHVVIWLHNLNMHLLILRTHSNAPNILSSDDLL